MAIISFIFGLIVKFTSINIKSKNIIINFMLYKYKLHSLTVYKMLITIKKLSMKNENISIN